MRYSIKIGNLAISLLLVVSNSFAQPGTSVDLKKPQQYENRELRSEKSTDKKLSTPKRILQNTFTHYNYYFNANNKLNQVVDRAKASYQEDYTKLLPFYNYTLDGTAQQKNDIDSVIYKCTAGILLHDLRNDWIDNLYLLLGQAYMYRKDFDSATQTFQYLNYAYAPKDDGYDIPIGSNASNTKGEFTIATKESKNLLKKIITHPQSRNESFIWQARNFVEQGELSDAAGLIEILRNDPNFPKRLKTELHEVISYWFYHQNAYDSAAFHLTKALDEADGRREKARWEYLIAQMYSLAGKNDLAVKYYNKAINHTVDPVMEVYARLNSLRINNSGQKDNYLKKNLDDLLKMARKDKYENYRDIIYYTAAKVEMERNNAGDAVKWLKKSVEASKNNPKQKAESFLMLADISYDTKAYVASSDYYDSTLTSDLKIEADKARVNERRPALKKISTNISKINEQDSLQRIARMPEAEREAYIRKLVKQLRKSKGLKDEPSSGGSNGSSGNSGTDIYADTKAEWYFSNPALKAKGYSEFKSRWGNRPNIDNWRRQQAIDRNAGKQVGGPTKPTDSENADSTEITYESLLAKVPLTDEQIKASNTIIQTALFENGKTFNESLEDHLSAIETFEELLRRFSNPTQKEEALFALIYLYNKTNNAAKAAAAKQQLLQEFPNGKFSQIIKESSSGNTANTASKTDAATKKYEEIYNLFISGKFDQAVEEKKKADAAYGNSFWTPQLLFIESIYYIKQRLDSTAINRLTAITTQFSASPLAQKAKTMIDVLGRRKQIEDYLTNLDIQRNENDRVERVVMTEPDKKTTTKPVEQKETITNKPVAVENKQPIKIDSIDTKPAIVTSAGRFSFAPAESHYTAIVLDQVDGMYVNEVKNAFNKYNLEKFYRQVIKVSSQPLDDRYTMVLLGPFKNAGEAMDYIDKARPAAAGNILPWLGAEKYSFLIINNTNLELLKQSKDLPGYKKMLTETLPGKF